MSKPPLTTEETLNLETAKIPWAELQRFFASGNAIYVSTELDLIEVAKACHQDNAKALKAWMNSEQVHPVKDDEAKNWHETNASVWAVVVAPWVLVQQINQPKAY